jgi:hypothetical protein
VISSLAYANRLEYLINTKLQLEISHDLKHDICCALHDYAIHSEQVLHKEKEQWKQLYFNSINEK